MEPRDDGVPEDVLTIHEFAAIGDSYSAGIGAGDGLGSIYDAFEDGSGKFATLSLCNIR